MSTRRDSGVTQGRRNNMSQNQLAGPSNGSRRGVRRIGSIQEGPADSWAHVGPWAAKDDEAQDATAAVGRPNRPESRRGNGVHE
jgi:hypothetical protein